MSINTNDELKQRAQQVLKGVPHVLDAADPLDQASGEFETLETTPPMQTEAIVFDVGRPALFMSKCQTPGVNGPPWQPWFKAHGTNISAACPSVGLIVTSGLNPRPTPATGFLVDKNVIMTCQHVLNTFTTGFPGKRKLRVGAKPFIVFGAEAGANDTVQVPIVGVVGEHKQYDAVLLRIGNASHLPAAALKLAPKPWPGTKPRPVCAIGHPAMLPPNAEPIYHQVFPPPYEVKRVSPGLATQGGDAIPLVLHDASTWEGNSGSPIVDFQTGFVVGLHFAGTFHVENRAVPSWQLTSDSFVDDGSLS
jgi:endonuclease G, mitochondrial